MFTLSLLLCVAGSAQDIATFVSQQMALYPKSHLIDICKSCFQDYMGAEHLVTDRSRAKASLDRELRSMDSEGRPECYYEPCGIYGRYVRVSLWAVKEGLITQDVLVDAFVRSGNKNRRSVWSWQRRWREIVGQIDEMALNLPNYDWEKQLIDSILSDGKYAFSHSPEYREAYHPHYRIVERYIFERELLPLLHKKCSNGTLEPIRGDALHEHSPNVFLVTYDPEAAKANLLKAITEYECEVIYDYKFFNGMALKKPDNKTLEETMQYFRGIEGIVTVEYDHITRLTDPIKPNLMVR